MSELPSLPWYVQVIRLPDGSVAAHECASCRRTWKPYEIEVHRADCKRRDVPNA